MKTCVGCGREFHPSGNRQLRCNVCRFGLIPKAQHGRRMRRCEVCGGSFFARSVAHKFCGARCASIAARPVRKAKYENPVHRGTRKAWERVVAQGRTSCVRCGQLILPGEPWDLGHADGESPGGPEHASCNRAAPSRLAAKRRRGR